MNTYYLLSGTYNHETNTFEGEISTVQANKKPRGKWWYESKEPKITSSMDYYSSKANAEKALADRILKAERAQEEEAARNNPKIIDITPFLLKRKEVHNYGKITNRC